MTPFQSRRPVAALLLTALAALPFAFSATLLGQNTADTTPRWIWAAGQAGDDQTVYFRKEFTAPDRVSAARLVAVCDNSFRLLLDGKPVAEGSDWNEPTAKDVTGHFVGQAPAGRKHVLAVVGKNAGGPAGLLVRLTFETRRGAPVTIASDASWKVSDREAKGWANAGFEDAKWAPATVLGKLGDGPWAAINDATLAVALHRREPMATAPDQFKVAKGFKVELLYTVPKDTQGSWVNMTTDPKGRLIVSDQYGKLYRVTPPKLGGEPAETKVEAIDVPLGEAQGMTWAFDALYVVVNRGEKYESGLYRVKDTDGDDKLDKVEQLRKLNGGGEHGPHAVIPSPDGKSLHVIAGNATQLTELAGSLVPRLWDEDQILPYMPDGNGFMSNERAPGGCVYKVDPEGKDWTLVSMGYRNPFDMAFNKAGDLFTYDSDMEWDVNTPWYRPTRVCFAASGSDLGYRNGSGKWPTYYPDSLPPVVNVGPGSPTGVTFGYGAAFPQKYQEALFICDWSYGKLYATHIKPDGAGYVGELEEFVTGTPLPLTDVVVNPVDKAMYFTIGGRRTLSGLYRVTYTGGESTASAPADASSDEARAIRRKLEAFHGKKDPKAVDVAWPYLGNTDRFIRYAARVAVESQDVNEWRGRALAEQDTQTALTALLALARADKKPRTDDQILLITALTRLGSQKLWAPHRLELLRVYELAFIRLGKDDKAQVEKAISNLARVFPWRLRALDAETCKILIALGDPSITPKAVQMMLSAPTQEEQIDYATALRLQRVGWTPELRRAYFAWFPRAATFKGGASIQGFMREIKNDAVATLSPEEKTALKDVLEAKPQTAVTAAELAPPRPFVKEWKVDDLAPAFEKHNTGRDFDRGRTLFAAANCFSCHRFDNEGGTVGPDLTGVAGRFSPRDLLESIVLPSKSISDQYAAVTIATTDGRVVTGRIVNLNGDNISVNTNMLDPNAQVNVNRRQIEETKPSPVSMMPEGLLNTLKEDEVFDLLAYVLSRGDRNDKMFKQGGGN